MEFDEGRSGGIGDGSQVKGRTTPGMGQVQKPGGSFGRRTREAIERHVNKMSWKRDTTQVSTGSVASPSNQRSKKLSTAKVFPANAYEPEPGSKEFFSPAWVTNRKPPSVASQTPQLSRKLPVAARTIQTDHCPTKLSDQRAAGERTKLRRQLFESRDGSVPAGTPQGGSASVGRGTGYAGAAREAPLVTSSTAPHPGSKPAQQEEGQAPSMHTETSAGGHGGPGHSEPDAVPGEKSGRGCEQEDLMTQLKSICQERDAARKEVEEMMAKQGTINTTLEAQLAEVQDGKAEMEERFKCLVARLQGDLAALVREKNVVCEQFAEQRGKAVAAEVRYTQAKAEGESISTELLHVRKEKASADAFQNLLITEKQQLKEAHESNLRAMGLLEDSLQNKEKAVQAEEAERLQLGARVTSLEEKEDNLAAVSAASAEEAATTSKLQAVELESQKAQDERLKAEGALEEASKEVQTVQQQMESLKQDLSNAKLEATKLMHKVNGPEDDTKQLHASPAEEKGARAAAEQLVESEQGIEAIQGKRDASADKDGLVLADGSWILIRENAVYGKDVDEYVSSPMGVPEEAPKLALLQDRVENLEWEKQCDKAALQRAARETAAAVRKIQALKWELQQAEETVQKLSEEACVSKRMEKELSHLMDRLREELESTKRSFVELEMAYQQLESDREKKEEDSLRRIADLQKAKDAAEEMARRMIQTMEAQEKVRESTLCDRYGKIIVEQDQALQRLDEERKQLLKGHAAKLEELDVERCREELERQRLTEQLTIELDSLKSALSAADSREELLRMENEGLQQQVVDAKEETDKLIDDLQAAQDDAMESFTTGRAARKECNELLAVNKRLQAQVEQLGRQESQAQPKSPPPKGESAARRSKLETRIAQLEDYRAADQVDFESLLASQKAEHQAERAELEGRAVAAEEDLRRAREKIVHMEQELWTLKESAPPGKQSGENPTSPNHDPKSPTSVLPRSMSRSIGSPNHQDTSGGSSWR